MLAVLTCPKIKANICIDKIISYITENELKQSSRAQDFLDFLSNSSDGSDEYKNFLNSLNSITNSNYFCCSKNKLINDIKTTQITALINAVILYYEDYIR